MLGEGVAEGEVMWAMRSAVFDDGVLNEAFFMCWDIDLLVRCLETLSFLERLPPETDSFRDRLPAEMLSWRLRLENMVCGCGCGCGVARCKQAVGGDKMGRAGGYGEQY
jgi:hypothetical protein